MRHRLSFDLLRAERRSVGLLATDSRDPALAGQSGLAEGGDPPTTTAQPTRGTHPERLRQAPATCAWPTSGDGSAPAESVRVTDRPASEGGRAYLVERGLETKNELDALIADYREQAGKLNCPPMSVCPLESSLEASA